MILNYFCSDPACTLCTFIVGVGHETGVRELLPFIEQIARMKTSEEYDDGMSGDDAVECVSGLVRDARALVDGHAHQRLAQRTLIAAGEVIE
jgi:hypothetical protein